MRMVPTIPLGAYPQFLLCGQVGITPSKMSMSTIIKTVPNDIIDPLLNCFIKNNCSIEESRANCTN